MDMHTYACIQKEDEVETDTGVANVSQTQTDSVCACPPPQCEGVMSVMLVWRVWLPSESRPMICYLSGTAMRQHDERGMSFPDAGGDRDYHAMLTVKSISTVCVQKHYK